MKDLASALDELPYRESQHYAQNWVWKKLKPADMRPWSPNYVVFCGPETVILKILTLAKRFLQTD